MLQTIGMYNLQTTLTAHKDEKSLVCIKWASVLALTLLVVYGSLFNFILTQQIRLDFSSLYSASQALTAEKNPYVVLQTTYLKTVKKLPVNLNPPFTLWLSTPFAKMNYDTAVLVWSALSFILGLAGARIAFKCAFSPSFMKKNGLILYFAYLSLYAVLMNTAIGQLGSILLFLVMYGYHFYRKKNDLFAGIMWGAIIAIKLFPGLFFIYALAQRRYQLFFIMLSVFSLLWLIPLYIHGTAVYLDYLSMLPRVLWYGDNWNASFYGFIFRLFVNPTNRDQSLFAVKLTYLILFGLAFLWYWLRVRKLSDKNHQAFSLTLVMMLLMSPFGWLYYFTLLVLPLSLTWLAAIQEKTRPTQAMIAWITCLFFLNFPMAYSMAMKMSSLTEKLGIYSIHFYGLLLLTYLASNTKSYQENELVIDQNNRILIVAPLAIFLFSVLVTIFAILHYLLTATN